MTDLKALLEAATPGPWSGHNMIHADEARQMTPEEIGEYVCNSVRMGSPDRFLFVSGKHDDGGDADVCHTGNGPRGPANTALIALAPTLAAALIEAEKALAKVSGAINDAFGAGAEERENGSENRQGRLIDRYEAVRAECRSTLARIRAITGETK